MTDVDRQFVIGIATSQDLSRYIARRGLTPAPSRGAADKSDADASMDVDGNQTPTRKGKDGAEANGAASIEAAGAGPSRSQPLSRRAEEERRKDRTLGEFLGMLDGYDPLVSTGFNSCLAEGAILTFFWAACLPQIPDEVTEHYLSKVGFECDDQRL